MITVPASCNNKNVVTQVYYPLIDFAQKLIDILPHSPRAFTHLLKVAFSNRVNLDEEDVHQMIDYISRHVGQDELEDHLANIESGHQLKLNCTPTISSDVMAILDADGVILSILLARHMHCDMSETNDSQKCASEQVLKDGQGIFKTSYKVHEQTVIVATDLATNTTHIKID